MKDFDAVVFDMDGVIFDSEKATLECWTEVTRRHGLPYSEKTYMATLGVTMEKTREIVLGVYGPDFPFEAYMREVSALYHGRYDGGRLPVKPGVRELLQYLKAQKKKIALASSTRRKTVLNQLRDAGLLEYFDEVVTGDMVPRSKPEPDIFLLACEKVAVQPERAFAVEDSFNGIRAAKSGGLRPIMVPDLLQPDEEIRGLAEAVLDDLYGAAAYLAE